MTLINVAMNDSRLEDPLLVGGKVGTRLPPDPDSPLMPLHLSSKQQLASQFFMVIPGSVLLQASLSAVSHIA